MHYHYYYYEQLLANEKNAIQRHLLTIACEVLLMAMMMSALCKYTYIYFEHNNNYYVRGFIGNKIGNIEMSNLDVF